MPRTGRCPWMFRTCLQQKVMRLWQSEIYVWVARGVTFARYLAAGRIRHAHGLVHMRVCRRARAVRRAHASGEYPIYNSALSGRGGPRGAVISVFGQLIRLRQVCTRGAWMDQCLVRTKHKQALFRRN